MGDEIVGKLESQSLSSRSMLGLNKLNLELPLNSTKLEAEGLEEKGEKSKNASLIGLLEMNRPVRLRGFLAGRPAGGLCM